MIKIGDCIINTEAIASVNLQSFIHKGFSNPVEHEGVEITMLSIQREDVTENISVSVSDTLFFEGEEAEALRWWFSQETQNSDISVLYRAAKGRSKK
jgi:hypothetical protein